MKITDNMTNLNKIDFSPKTSFSNTEENKEDKNIFNNMFNSFLDIYNETNFYQKQVDKAQLDFATGKTDDMLSVMMAQEKASTSLNFAVQVTNKVVESYREIMRIQM